MRITHTPHTHTHTHTLPSPQDVASAGGTATTVQGGLRPGAPPPPQQSPQQTPAAAAAAFLASMSDRFASAGTEQAPGEGVRGTSAGKPSGGEGMEGYVQQQQQQQGVGGGEFSQQQQGGGRLPVRHVEPWRPVPLLCKRLNVADPYKGKPAELEVWCGCFECGRFECGRFGWLCCGWLCCGTINPNHSTSIPTPL